MKGNACIRSLSYSCPVLSYPSINDDESDVTLSSLFYDIYSDQMLLGCPGRRPHCSFLDSVVKSLKTPHSQKSECPLVVLQIRPAHGAGNVRVLLDVLAGREHLPQLAKEGSVVAVVKLAKLRLDGVGGLLCAVEGDTASLC